MTIYIDARSIGSAISLLGITEVTKGLRYEALADYRVGDNIPWPVAGPTGDSVDIYNARRIITK